MTVQESQAMERIFSSLHVEFLRIYTEMLKGCADLGYTPEELFRCILTVAAENLGPQYPEKRHLIAEVRKYA